MSLPFAMDSGYDINWCFCRRFLKRSSSRLNLLVSLTYFWSDIRYGVNIKDENVTVKMQFRETITEVKPYT